MGGMSTRNEIKARLGILAEPPAKAKMARPTQEHQHLLNEFKALDQGIGRLYDRVGQMMAKSDAIIEHFPKDERNPDPAAIAKSMAMIKALQSEMNAMLARHKFARPGVKAKMAVNRRKVVQDLEYLRDEARRVNDASSRMDAENWLKRVRARDLKEQDWLEAADAVSQISAVLNSRPGAKAKMATSYESDNQLYDRVMPSIIEMNQFVSLRIPSVQSSLKETATAAKRAAAFGEKILKERAASPEMLRELDRLVSVVKAQYGYRITQRGASFARPGAKAKMDLTDVQRKAGYKWRVAYTRQLGKDQYLGGPPVTMQDDLLFATESAARQWADAMLKKGWFKGQGGGPEKILKATVLMASRIGAKSTHAAADKPGRKVMAESDPAVSAKIRKLMAEGKPQKQAVAIALDMKRRGEI